MLLVAEIHCSWSFTLARTGSMFVYVFLLGVLALGCHLPAVSSRQSQSHSAWRRRDVFKLRKIGVRDVVGSAYDAVDRMSFLYVCVVLLTPMENMGCLFHSSCMETTQEKERSC
ncbi:phosphatase [Sesbania bispinosa]|nr:phosphatase [Sesbania bispinosa]